MNKAVFETYVAFLDQHTLLVSYLGQKTALLQVDCMGDLIAEPVPSSGDCPCDAILLPYGIYRPL